VVLIIAMVLAANREYATVRRNNIT